MARSRTPEQIERKDRIFNHVLSTALLLRDARGPLSADDAKQIEEVAMDVAEELAHLHPGHPAVDKAFKAAKLAEAKLG